MHTLFIKITINNSFLFGLQLVNKYSSHSNLNNVENKLQRLCTSCAISVTIILIASFWIYKLVNRQYEWRIRINHIINPK